MKILLYGPPGVGKSTIIKYISSNTSIPCYDLENEYKFAPSDVRASFRKYAMRHADCGIFAMAEVPLTLIPLDDEIKALLYLPQADYEERRTKRDSSDAWKSRQAPQLIDLWKSKFNGIIIDASGSVSETADLIIGLYNSYRV